MRIRLLPSLVLLGGLATASLLPGAAVAAEGVCQGLLKQTEIDACLEARFEDTSETVADAFETLLAGTTDAAVIAYLTEGQAAWTAARDRACAEEGADYEGGSMQQGVIWRCLGDANVDRTDAILATMDEILRAKAAGSFEVQHEPAPRPRPDPQD